MRKQSNGPVRTKTGKKAPVSGLYRPEGAETEFTFVAGKRVPPGPGGITEFTLVNRARHMPRTSVQQPPGPAPLAGAAIA